MSLVCAAVECPRTRHDLEFFLRADLTANGLSQWRNKYRIAHRLAYYQWILRRCEFWEHQTGLLSHVIARVLSVRLVFLGERLGVSIPRHTVGPGLRIAHGGAVIIGPGSRIGRNLCIHQGVTIGQVGDGHPRLGDSVWIGAGAHILGAVDVGEGVAVAANAVVVDDVPPGVTVGGVPATVLNARSSARWLADACSTVERDMVARPSLYANPVSRMRRRPRGTKSVAEEPAASPKR